MKTTHRAILIVTVAAVGIWAWRTWEFSAAARARAYRECKRCLLVESDVDELIDRTKRARGSREQIREGFFSPLDGSPDEARECERCGNAVLDAAGKR